MDILSRIKELAKQCDIYELEYIEIPSLKYYSEIRTICENNSCKNYNTSWACPPAIGTIEECKQRVEKYNKMILFTRKYELKSSFDIKGMVKAMKDFKSTVDKFQNTLDEILDDFMLLSNEGCGKCAECTYPSAPCRFPEDLHHSIEGYGFIVNELAQEAGIKYNNGPNTVTYFGALLFNYNK